MSTAEQTRARRARMSPSERERTREQDRLAHAARRAALQARPVMHTTTTTTNTDAATSGVGRAEVTDVSRIVTRANRETVRFMPLARRPLREGGESTRHYLPRMNVPCRYCRALHWINERVVATGSTITSPLFTMCCDKGKVELPPLLSPPHTLLSLYVNDDEDSREFRRNIRAYNCALSFTSVGTTMNDDFNLGHYQLFRIQGSLYHRIGILLPSEGSSRKFSQLYIADSDAALNGRLAVFPTLHRRTLSLLQDMIFQYNPYAQLYRTVQQRIALDGVQEISMRLICLTSTDQRTYNTPSSSEVGGILVGDGCDGVIPERDIIVKSISGPLQRISASHSAYTPLHYVLLFPDGRQGWSDDIPLRSPPDTSILLPRGRHGSLRVTQMQYYSYMLHPRNSNEHLFLACRLLQQYMVDAWACVEQNRLNYFRENQVNLRCEVYSGIMDAIDAGDHDALRIGQRFILPSSFAGGNRNMNQLYQDSMAIVRRYGRPDLFITFTCNPKCTDLMNELECGQRALDRPDLIARWFSIKFDMLMHDIKEKKIFGGLLGYTWVIEFQKRGLPHAHILLILDNESKLRTTEDIDSIISAEIPDSSAFPELYSTVTKCMFHGPCGHENPTAACMDGGRCSKRFPRSFNNSTSADADGYPLYRRRDNSIFFIDSQGRRVDNRWVVPYNPYLCARYNSHINVEVCSSVSAVKYMYKYVYKGHDRTTTVLRSNNEIQQYVDARYVSSSEAAWRLFGFKLHDGYPPVQRLQVHLPGQHRVTFNSSGILQDIVTSGNSSKTTLTEWFIANSLYENGREYSYIDFPSAFVWHNTDRTWKPRQSGKSIGRIYFVNPNAGERYFLRTLLTVVKGATSFECLRTYDGIIYDDFKSACIARGLYENDQEWFTCLQEASQVHTGARLRALFVTILIHGPPADVPILWEHFKNSLSDDCVTLLQALGVHDVSEALQLSFCLSDISRQLASFEKTLTHFNLPHPDIDFNLMQPNHLIIEQLNSDINVLLNDIDEKVPSLNDGQRQIYDVILAATTTQPENKLFFIDGPGGTGKTYLENVILSTIRSRGRIAIAVASSGIASLLLQKGRTAHSRFKIPIDIREHSVCSISMQGDLAEMLRHAALILWDETPMLHKFVFHALDRAMRDVCANDFVFGGIATVLSGDFRQVLPVMPKGLRPDIVASSIKESYIWSYIRVHHLIKNMRSTSINVYEDLGDRTFAQWLIALGENKLPIYNDDFVICPNLFTLQEQTISSLISKVYPDISLLQNANSSYLGARVILAATNQDVDLINSIVLSIAPGDQFEFISADRIESEEYESNVPVEYVNSLQISGLPPHRLYLKIGSPVILLRNLDPLNGLCNGARLIVLGINRRVIECKIMNGSHACHIAFIPRIPLTTENTGLPFAVRRRQFPIQLACAMTINKSQGQSLEQVGICLTNDVFSHGQLYVAFSRGRNPMNISVLLNSNNLQNDYFLMRNVVYEEALI